MSALSEMVDMKRFKLEDLQRTSLVLAMYNP